MLQSKRKVRENEKKREREKRRKEIKQDGNKKRRGNTRQDCQNIPWQKVGGSKSGKVAKCTKTSGEIRAYKGASDLTH